GVHPNVAGTVKLRLNLPDLGGHQLVVVDESILAKGTARGRSGNAHLPSTCPEGRRLAMVVLADRDRLVLLDGGQGPRNVGGVAGVVGCARPPGPEPPTWRAPTFRPGACPKPALAASEPWRVRRTPARPR